MSNADRVADFCRAIGEPVPTSPLAPPVPVLDLRRTLLSEEFAETIAALDVVRARVAAGDDVGIEDLAAVGHELADLLYVTYGTFLALGLPADAVFAEVHRANLAKAAGPRRADGKQLRPEGWRPADVVAVIAG